MSANIRSGHAHGHARPRLHFERCLKRQKYSGPVHGPCGEHSCGSRTASVQNPSLPKGSIRNTFLPSLLSPFSCPLGSTLSSAGPSEDCSRAPSPGRHHRVQRRQYEDKRRLLREWRVEQAGCLRRRTSYERGPVLRPRRRASGRTSVTDALVQSDCSILTRSQCQFSRRAIDLGSQR